MNDPLDSLKNIPDKLPIPNISMDKFIPRVFLHILQVIQVPSISELIQVDDLTAWIMIQHIMNEIAAYKTCPTCNQ
jgi:hypothetical protein